MILPNGNTFESWKEDHYYMCHSQIKDIRIEVVKRNGGVNETVLLFIFQNGVFASFTIESLF